MKEYIANNFTIKIQSVSLTLISNEREKAKSNKFFYSKCKKSKLKLNVTKTFK